MDGGKGYLGLFR